MASERTQKLANRNFWDELMAMRDEQRARLKTATQVVRGDELPLENNRQGLMRWYMHPAITDTALSTLMCFEQQIPPRSRSGRLKFQGGQVVYILEGSGYTMMDGVKYAWEAGDILNLPLRENGIIVQHVNDSDTDSVRFIAVEANWFSCTGVDRGSGFEQIEDAPDYERPVAADPHGQKARGGGHG